MSDDATPRDQPDQPDQRESIDQAEAEARRWRETTYRRAVERGGERKTTFTPSSDIETQPLYTEADLAGWRADEALGFPGEYPYTRGIQPTMYRGRLWTMRQYAGYATAEESNRRYRYLLEQGGSGLSVAFDLPTQMGYDADHTLAEGEVGKVGVSISSLDDMRVLFDGIPLERITTSMTINATAAILLALYIAVAREQGADV
ncbi:MAG TPA: methylmalonyl-CoA mutase family protein, partial [Ktedonobacterales bacterium]